MSSSLSSDHLARLRVGTRRLTDHTVDHETQLGALVLSSEADVSAAHAALAEASDAHSDLEQLRDLLAAQLQRSVDHALSARRACVSAREQQAAARRLLRAVDGASAENEVTTPLAPETSVLVVDDAADAREVLMHVLRSAGFCVRSACNGLEAVIAAHEMRPAVIVMDMSMPVLDGIEATRLIKATETARDARVIAHTAYPGVAHGLVKRLFVGVLPKPSSPDLVVSLVRQAARS